MNDDLILDTTDIDAWYMNIVDLNGDEQANLEDLDYLVIELFGTQFGDANYDMKVDLAKLATNFGFVASPQSIAISVSEPGVLMLSGVMGFSVLSRRNCMN